VRTATSCAEAIERLDRQVSFAIINTSLSDGSGIELAERLRRHGADLLVVFLESSRELVNGNKLGERNALVSKTGGVRRIAAAVLRGAFRVAQAQDAHPVGRFVAETRSSPS
jgi:ActR/RegA family two-component response regulator